MAALDDAPGEVTSEVPEEHPEGGGSAATRESADLERAAGSWERAPRCTGTGHEEPETRPGVVESEEESAEHSVEENSTDHLGSARPAEYATLPEWSDEEEQEPPPALEAPPSQQPAPRAAPLGHLEEEVFNPAAAPSLSRSPSSVCEGLPPHSPVAGVWLAEPASIDEPLLLLDEEEAQERAEDEIARLRAELAEARAAAKADRASLDAMEHTVEAVERERDGIRSVHQQLEQENTVLRLQLQDHHGIMAADWEQTLGFKEQLRKEEAAHERLAGEVAELREAAAASAEEAAMLRQDAGRWRLLCRPEEAVEASAAELDAVAEVAMAAVPVLHAEARLRSRRMQVQLHSELEQQLCAVCKDAKKAVLFLPCLHVCVCERCRSRLKPYRCPICQEPVQGAIGRVHF